MSHSDLDLIRTALANLRFGEITIAVHDGEIVQISRTEKTRPTKLGDKTKRP